MSVWNYIEELAEERKQRTKNLEVEQYSGGIPTAEEAKLEVNRWYRVDEAVAVFADMRGSTQLSGSKNAPTLGKMYELFTGSWVKVLHNMKAGYVDIKGDGGFGLFYGKAGVVQALLAAITFRSIITQELRDFAATLTDGEKEDWRLEAKVGLHKGSLLVKKIGDRNAGGSQKNWLVWAGKPVNYAAKLSSLAEPETVLATKPIYETIVNTDILKQRLVESCGCPDGVKDLWVELETNSSAVEAVGGTPVYSLQSVWCTEQGDRYFDDVRDYLANKKIEVGVPAL